MTAHSDYTRIEKAIRYVGENFRAQPSLAQIAARTGLSEYHFQRMFRRWAGISPKRFLQYLTANYARQLLHESRTVLEVSDAAGLSGGGRLHDLFVNLHAVTPGEVRAFGADLAIRFGFHATRFGECLVALTTRGVCGLEFVMQAGHKAAVARLKSQWPAAIFHESPRATHPVVERLFGTEDGGQIDLFVSGSNFQIKVWEALLRIPSGRVVAYTDIAARIGRPAATRAVASAIAHNRVAVLIPCHRVIRNSGAFGEYRWGAARKQALVGHELSRRVSALPADAEEVA